MTTPNDLSDQALAIFTSAAFHQHQIGEAVTGVADSDCHRTDLDGVADLVRLHLAEVTNGKISFTPAGQLLLAQIAELLRGAR